MHWLQGSQNPEDAGVLHSCKTMCARVKGICGAVVNFHQGWRDVQQSHPQRVVSTFEVTSKPKMAARALAQAKALSSG